jgi:hypothetical protein
MASLVGFFFNPRVFLVLLVIAALLCLVLAAGPADTSNSHAESKHGARGAEISNGCNSGNIIISLFNAATGRCANVYGDSKGYGVQITQNMDGSVSEVTAFPKEGASDALDVVLYLIGAGYHFIFK